MSTSGIFWLSMVAVWMVVYLIAFARQKPVYASNADLTGLPTAIIATAIASAIVGALVAITLLSGLATEYEIFMPLF